MEGEDARNAAGGAPVGTSGLNVFAPAVVDNLGESGNIASNMAEPTPSRKEADSIRPLAPEANLVRIVLRPLGSAMPIGLLGYGAGVLLPALLGLHWIPAAQSGFIGLMLLVFSVPLLWGASVLSLLGRDALEGTTMAAYGGVWMVLGLFLLRHHLSERFVAMGVFACLAAGTTLTLGVLAWHSKRLMAVILWISFLRFALMGASLCGAQGVGQAGNWVALPLAALAFYGAVAFLVEDMTGKPLLPVFRQSTSKLAVEGGLVDQLRQIYREAGVRKRL